MSRLKSAIFWRYYLILISLFFLTVYFLCIHESKNAYQHSQNELANEYILHTKDTKELQAKLDNQFKKSEQDLKEVLHNFFLLLKFSPLQWAVLFHFYCNKRPFPNPTTFCFRFDLHLNLNSNNALLLFLLWKFLTQINVSM